MIAIPFPFVLAEIFLFFFFTSRFGFGPTFLAYLIPSFLGVFLLAFQSRTAFFSLQSRLAEGREPGPQLLNTGAKFIGAVLLVVPLFSTRVIGALLVIPGVRQMMLFLFQAWIFQRFAKGVFGNIRPGGPGMNAHFRTHRFERDAQVVDIDAEVIDVTPLSLQDRTPSDPRA